MALNESKESFLFIKDPSEILIRSFCVLFFSSTSLLPFLSLHFSQLCTTMATEKPTSRQTQTQTPRRRRVVIIAASVVVVLALVLGLVFGLRGRNKHNNDTQDFAEDWNHPSQFLLSKNFSITSTATTRYYEWNVTQQTIAPDGLERPMLLVNGKQT